MSRLLTGRGYARHRKAHGLTGGTEGAVRKALRTGRITAEPDGRIDPATADRSWAGSTEARVFLTRDGGTRATWSKPADPEPDNDNDGRKWWSLTKAMRRRFGVWLQQLRALDDAVQAEVERTHDDGFSPPTGVPQLDAYIDFLDFLSATLDALQQAADPALVRYKPLIVVQEED